MYIILLTFCHLFSRADVSRQHGAAPGVRILRGNDAGGHRAEDVSTHHVSPPAQLERG